MTSTPTPSPHGSLVGRVALVTGGGSGIGRGIARALSAAGMAVAVSGRRREVVEAEAAALEALGRRAIAVAGDVSRPEEARRMVETTVKELGDLHVVVNNAGIARVGPIAEMTATDVEAVIDIDLKGPIFVTQAALPYLRRHKEIGGAAIVNVSSSVTQIALKNFSVYSAAKAGVDRLTKCWALELAADRIRVNAVCPGVVETRIYESMMPPDQVPGYLTELDGVTPLGRRGQPADVARLVLFLAGPESAWITGAVIPVDGGISLGDNSLGDNSLGDNSLGDNSLGDNG